MRIRWTHRAERDLVTIGWYTSRDNLRAAHQFISRIRARARRAAELPRSGRIVPEVRREDVREVIEGNYRVVYRVTKASIDVLTVFEGHQLLPDRAIPDKPDAGR